MGVLFQYSPARKQIYLEDKDIRLGEDKLVPKNFSRKGINHQSSLARAFRLLRHSQSLARQILISPVAFDLIVIVRRKRNILSFKSLKRELGKQEYHLERKTMRQNYEEQRTTGPSSFAKMLTSHFMSYKMHPVVVHRRACSKRL